MSRMPNPHSHPRPIAIVNDDESRPGRPDLKSLYLSGYTDDLIARHGVLQSGIHFIIQKPFSLGDLSEKMRVVLGRE